MKTGSHRIVGRARATELQIPAGDGRLLGATMFAPAEPSGQEHPVTVLASATGVKRGFYDAYALYLAEGGLHAITFDYRGIGGSRSGALGSFRATAREWGELDLDGVLSWAMARFPGERVGILGHSIGGQLVGLAARAADADRVLMISAQSGYWPLFNAPLKYLYALLWYAGIPALTRLCGFLPAKRLGLGEDLPAGVAQEWAQWCRTPGYLIEALDDPAVQARFERIRAPLLAYSVSDDQMAPPRAVDALLALYRNADVERRHIVPRDIGLPSLGHFGFFRSSARGSLWDDTRRWLGGAAIDSAERVRV